MLDETKHAALIHKSKSLLARNQENRSEWGFAYTHELLILTKHVVILQSSSSAYIDANHERESVKVAQLTINFR
jgi:hypothetical protein